MELKQIGSNQTTLTLQIQTSKGKDFTVLFSYSTPVAAQLPDGSYVQTAKKWSQTTTKHINKWLRDAGLNPLNVETWDQETFDAMAQTPR